MSIVSAENIMYQYPGTEKIAIRDLSFSVQPGEFVAVLGHNGSGKSTLARLLNGILIPTGGKLSICDSIVEPDADLTALRKHVGMVFQNPDNQIVASVVEEDVAFALENTCVPYEEMHQRVAEALDSVGMSEYASHSTYKLSGGQKQRVAIAGVIALRPDVLILDEPTAMLDPQGRREVLDVLKRFHKHGMTIILITHFMSEAVLADRVLVFDNGQILLDGSPHEVFQNAGLLWNVGLTVPDCTELMFRLREAGYKVPLAVLSEEECYSVLQDLLSGKIEREEYYESRT